MANSKDQTGGMGRLSKKTKDKVDEALKEDEISLLKNTEVDLESLRPKVSDGESFDKLIEAVNTATKQNESIAQLKKRIMNLGEGVVNVAKEVLKELPKL